jgi:hypothetical protein
MNKHSYRYELIKNKKGMFDNYVDMVYILTMENSDRKEHYMNQINTYIPHKNILIQYNKGFTNCKKKLQHQDTINDLNDAYYHAFLNALQKNYKNIIIFEDDFTFDYNINQLVVDDIGKFIKTNNYHIYHLGSLFHISIPSISMHLKSYYITSSHGVIYNRDYVYYYIKNYEKGFKHKHWKLWLNMSIIKYTYYKPLCFQIMNKDKKIFGKVYELFNLNKNHNPGYKIFNIISFIISFHLIYLFINYKFLLGLK